VFVIDCLWSLTIHIKQADNDLVLYVVEPLYHCLAKNQRDMAQKHGKKSMGK
jgi:hypothetical protein